MNVTNLNEAVIAVALAVIVAWTIVAAYFAWMQGREQVILEAFETIRMDQQGALELTLAVSLCNRRRSSVQPLFLEIRGLPTPDVNCTDDLPVGDREQPSRAPFPHLPVPPFEAREATFRVGFDWQAARVASPAGGGDLPWQAIVTLSDRHRRGKRWTQALNLAFHGEELHRLTASDSPPVERRSANRPFSGASASSRRLNS